MEAPQKTTVSAPHLSSVPSSGSSSKRHASLPLFHQPHTPEAPQKIVHLCPSSFSPEKRKAPPSRYACSSPQHLPEYLGAVAAGGKFPPPSSIECGKSLPPYFPRCCWGHFPSSPSHRIEGRALPRTSPALSWGHFLLPPTSREELSPVFPRPSAAAGGALREVTFRLSPPHCRCPLGTFPAPLPRGAIPHFVSAILVGGYRAALPGGTVQQSFAC